MSDSCQNCAHFKDSEWAVLGGCNAKGLDCARRSRHFLPGEPVYHEGDEPSGIYCVSSGLIGIRKVDAEGDSMLLRLVRPGQTFGYRSALTGASPICTQVSS